MQVSSLLGSLNKREADLERVAYKILSPQTEGWDDLVGLGTYKLTLAR